MFIDYHVHAAAHGEYIYSYEWISSFLQKASDMGINEIGFSEHDEFAGLIDKEVLIKVQEKYPDVKIRLGLEVDYIPGKEKIIEKVTSANEYDYIIGSIHFIDGWAFDHPDYKDRFADKDIDEIYAQYFALVKEMVDTKLFDIVGHIDLIKKWGHRPVNKDIFYYVNPVLQAIKASDMVVEINCSGLQKPVGEIYPSPKILELMFLHNIPITFGSDAHHTTQLGKNISDVMQIARNLGYRHIAKFEQRKRYMVSI